MNNDNEIMKEFNETFGNKPEVPVQPYYATQNQNLNTANVNSDNYLNNNTQNVSHENTLMPNFINQNQTVNMVPEVNNTIVNDNNQVLNSNNNQQLYNTTNYINDRPVENKTKKNTIKINPELKTVILLAVILLIAMALVPTLFDLYDSLKIKIFS